MNTYTPVPLRPDRAAYEADQRRSLTRAITSMALGGHRDAEAVLQRAWPHDPVAGLLLKAAVSPTSTSSYPSYATTKTLPALAPQSASMKLFAQVTSIDLAGVSTIRIPNVALAPQPGFIGEGAAAPLAQFSLGGVDLGPARKILIQAAVTGELENATPEAASAIIGRELAAAVAKSMDAAVFSNVAASSVRPAGLLFAVTPITATTPGASDLEAAAADLAALAAEIADRGIDPTGMVIVAAWPQAMKLQLLSGANFANAIIGTPALADGTVVGVAPGGVFVGYSGAPEIETSREALAHFEDTTPLPISTGTQGSGVLATPARSAFQTDSLIIKVRARCAWVAVPGAIQLVQSVGW